MSVLLFGLHRAWLYNAPTFVLVEFISELSNRVSVGRSRARGVGGVDIGGLVVLAITVLLHGLVLGLLLIDLGLHAPIGSVCLGGMILALIDRRGDVHTNLRWHFARVMRLSFDAQNVRCLAIESHQILEEGVLEVFLHCVLLMPVLLELCLTVPQPVAERFYLLIGSHAHPADLVLQTLVPTSLQLSCPL